ncbi:hypothetical protein ZIOFF_013538 [Zingiber officinale]|uniref:PQ-loop repeat family protein / transmembrane family protein n=1 Tax=Zingiber officinale TaxID=94328 RepID=A0A8J5HBS9_ZINOF|nr:hypothetical protein ZIOFF_013538 [Zingiber officinale]
MASPCYATWEPRELFITARPHYQRVHSRRQRIATSPLLPPNPALLISLLKQNTRENPSRNLRSRLFSVFAAARSETSAHPLSLTPVPLCSVVLWLGTTGHPSIGLVGYICFVMAHSKASFQPTCPSIQHCSDWARIYLKYCLCSAKDGVSIFLGIVSIISWGVAEVPQILTNFREKSIEGLSAAFLMTWVVGQVFHFHCNILFTSDIFIFQCLLRGLCVCRDLFNLIGCILEPATLPTQYYTALLHLQNQNLVQDSESLLSDAEKTNVGGHKANVTSLSEDNNLKSSPIPVTRQLHPGDSNGRDFYFVYLEMPVLLYIFTSNQPLANLSVSVVYLNRRQDNTHVLVLDGYHFNDARSARSLSKSPMPTFGTWLAYSHENGIPYHFNDGQHDEQFAAREPLLSSQSAPTKLSTKNILSVVPSASLSICICVYHLCFHDSTESHGMVLQVGRKLLQDELRGDESSGAGTLFGWMMAAIYVGGRLPQICLNVRVNLEVGFRRYVAISIFIQMLGSLITYSLMQGLNPLMFIFALVGNITYVGSILVKSLAWSAIKPNLPWLVDAGGCAILDAFIIIQFVYFRLRQSKKSASNNNQV